MRKFSEILGSRAKVDLEFIDIQEDETSAGQQFVKLILKKPIPLVVGGKRRDNTSGDSIALEASDVEVVFVNPDALAEIEKLEADGKELFTWEVEGKSGTFKTSDLRLDVSSNLDVWVVKQTFAAWAKEQRDGRNTRKNTTLMNKMNDAKAKRELAGADLTGTRKVEPAAVVKE